MKGLFFDRLRASQTVRRTRCVFQLSTSIPDGPVIATTIGNYGPGFFNYHPLCEILATPSLCLAKRFDLITKPAIIPQDEMRYMSDGNK